MATKTSGWSCTHTASIVSQTDTTATIRVTCYWKNNSWYYNINYVSAWVYCNGESYLVKDSGNVNAPSSSGTYNIGSHDFTINKTTSSKLISCYAKITSNSSYVQGTKTSTSTNISVSAKTSYKVTYNANGGIDAPANQTKWHGTTLTLSSTKPIRTGYSFQGWGTSVTTTTVSYNAGASYTANKAITLYAVWKANTYTVKYNANGGINAPANQTKTHGTTLTLSSTKPTRTNYTFKGWGTSATTTTVSYASGVSYTANKAVTLYAIWELSYVKPRLKNVSVKRCNASGTLTGSGTYIKCVFNWETDKTVSSVVIKYKQKTATSWTSNTVSGQSGKSGSVSVVLGGGNINTEYTYNCTITVTDAGGNTSKNTTIPTAKFIIDVKGDGSGLALGKAAETSNLFDVNFPTKFNKNVVMEATQNIRGIKPDGTEVVSFDPSNSNGNVVIGWGNYDANDGNTNIYGKDVNIGSSQAGKVTFRPYYRKGDSFNVTLYTSGFVTGGGVDIHFVVPVHKQIIGDVTLSASSRDGFIIRQNGGYAYGSASDLYVKPSKYQTVNYSVTGGCIHVSAVMPNSTNITNNSSLGIQWSGTITIS